MERGKVGDHLQHDLWMNTDDVSAITHFFNIKIIVLNPFSKHIITSAVTLALHMPLKGNEILSK